jgi:hypothetical protein
MDSDYFKFRMAADSLFGDKINEGIAKIWLDNKLYKPVVFNNDEQPTLVNKQQIDELTKGDWILDHKGHLTNVKAN